MYTEPEPNDTPAIFEELLMSFGGRAGRISDLFAHGRLGADRCFVALTHLWLQLAGAHQRRRAGSSLSEGTGRIEVEQGAEREG